MKPMHALEINSYSQHCNCLTHMVPSYWGVGGGFAHVNGILLKLESARSLFQVSQYKRNEKIPSEAFSTHLRFLSLDILNKAR